MKDRIDGTEQSERGHADQQKYAARDAVTQRHMPPAQAHPAHEEEGGPTEDSGRADEVA